MAVKRFFHSPISNDRIILDSRQAHHLREVLRLRHGDPVEILDGRGIIAYGMIESVTPKLVQIAIQRREVSHPRQTGRIVIAASMAKGDRFEWLLEKCTELGVDRITPLVFERTVKRPSGENILTRYQTLAAEAAKQCKRIFLPAIDPPLPFPESLERFQNEYPRARLLYGSISGVPIAKLRMDWTASDCIAYIGPEGDFTEDELAMLQSLPADPVRLASTVLRVETAALAMASCLTAMRL